MDVKSFELSGAAFLKLVEIKKSAL